VSLNSKSLRFNDKASPFFRVFDISILIIALFVAVLIHDIGFTKDYLLLLLASLVIFTFASEVIGLYYKAVIGKFFRRIVELFLVVNFVFLLIILTLFLMKETEHYSRFVIIVWYFLSLIMLTGWRLLYRSINLKRYKMGEGLKRVAIVGLTDSGVKVFDEIEQYKELGLKVVGFFDDRPESRIKKEGFSKVYLDKLQGNLNDLLVKAQNNELDNIYICLPLWAEKRIAEIIRIFGDSTINVYMVPDLLLDTLMHGEVNHLGVVTTISVFDTHLNRRSNQFVKRTEDIILSILILMLISPIMLIVALGVKLSSSGPVFYKQTRVGWGGKNFSMLKFRSMPVDVEKNGVQWGSAKDKTNTKFGQFIRSMSLDELPQFLNVLKGDMSIVGPRPERDVFVAKFRQEIPFYMQKHMVKAGITGWAQINGLRGDTSLEKRIEYDIQYINSWSLWFDIKIIFWTLFKGFVNKNAY